MGDAAKGGIFLVRKVRGIKSLHLPCFFDIFKISLYRTTKEGIPEMAG
ncbi:hypothetical protein BMS3Bbin06_00088 [bacterium BMS3Bbin06]|nr:hypothetical protein BMS3Bbin06_00088 [bacterium BMS3Bbin06]